MKKGDEVVLKHKPSKNQIEVLRSRSADVPVFKSRYTVIGVSESGETIHLRDLSHGTTKGWKSVNWKTVEPRYKSTLTEELAMKSVYFDEGCRSLQKQHLRIFNTNAKF